MTKAVMQLALDALVNSCDFIFKDSAKAPLRQQAIDELQAELVSLTPVAAPYTITPATKNFKHGDRLVFTVSTTQPLPVTLFVFLQSRLSGPNSMFLFGSMDSVNGNLTQQITLTSAIQEVVTDIIFTDEHRPFERKFKILLKKSMSLPSSVGESETLTLPAPAPTYTIQRIDPEGDRLTLWRGKQISYAITAQNLLSGEGIVFVTIDGGRVTPADITEGVTSAAVSIVGRKALLQFSASYPGFGELPFTLSLRTGSITGPVVAQCTGQLIRSPE